MQRITRNKDFYNSMLKIAFPIMIQQVIAISLNMIDTIMVGALGEDAISAVGLSNRFFFIFTTICFGIYSGASIFIAQYWGAGDKKSIKSIFGIDLMLGSSIAIIFSLITFFFPKQLMRIFIEDTTVIGLGAGYTEIIAVSYIFTAVSFAFSFNSRAVRKLKIPTIINVISIGINTFGNWILITGNLGFKAYGVEGAAFATLAARVFECIALIYFIYRDSSHPLAATMKELKSWDFKMLVKVLTTSIPVIVSETAWAVGTSVYFIAYGFMGSYAIAVVQVAYNIFDVFQAMFFGVGNASAIMIGNEIGKNNMEKSKEYSLRFIKITLALSIICSVSLFLCRGAIISLFSFEPENMVHLNKALIVFSLYFTPKMFTYIFICGILRAGGDTKFCMYIDILSIWFIGVPVAFFSVLVLKLPLYLVIAAVFSEELFKLVIVIKRYSSDKWINNLIR